jgi:signal peptidase
MTLTVVDAPAPGVPAVQVLGVPAPRTSAEQLPARRPGPRHARPPRRRWVDHLLTLAALLGVAMTVVTVLAAQTGLRPLVVRSGSMEPTIRTGSMVLVRDVPASAIRPGDVVAVERPDRTRVTHRVVTVEHRGATASLVLRGDANTDPDPEPVVVVHAGRLVATAPLLGRVGGFLASAKGGFVLGWLVAAVVLAVLRRKDA